jgi:tRNA modification GTPase
VCTISGHNLADTAASIIGGLPPARSATYTSFTDNQGEVIDQGIALFFPAPHSYTGEDVLELQGHGGPAVLQLLLQRCLELGARLALPGEFTQRAYLNDKLDLAQAESVADL